MLFKPKNIQDIAKKIKNNEIGIFPFDTLFGICGLIQTKEKINNLKQKPPQTELITIIPNTSYLKQFITPLTKKQKKIIDHYWPGPITFVFKKKDTKKNNETIAIRYPEFLPLNYLLNILKAPILSTSANLHKSPTATTIINKKLEEKCDFCYKEIAPLYQSPSTIVDITNKTPKILRKGATSFEY